MTSERPARLGGMLLLGVMALATLSAGRMYLLYTWREVDVDLVDLMVTGLVDWGLWLPLVLLVWWWGGRLPLEGSRRAWTGRALVHFGASLVFSWVQLAAFALVTRWMRERPGELVAAFQSAALVKLHAGVLVYWAVLLARHAAAARRRARTAELASARADERLAHARLDALQAHLRPHFLFNTLNTVAALVHRDPSGAERLLARLGDLLRRCLSEEGERWVPLEEELDFLQNYTAIERARLGPRLELVLDVPEDCRAARTPALLLQPLVENAIRHGVAPYRAGGRVTLRARRDGADVVLDIEDEPARLDEPPAEDATRGFGIGLSSTRERIRLLYGDAATLRIEPRAPAGTRVVVRWPWRWQAARAPSGAVLEAGA